jgi:hypothetical protein
MSEITKGVQRVLNSLFLSISLEIFVTSYMSFIFAVSLKVEDIDLDKFGIAIGLKVKEIGRLFF